MLGGYGDQQKWELNVLEFMNFRDQIGPICHKSFFFFFLEVLGVLDNEPQSLREDPFVCVMIIEVG